MVRLKRMRRLALGALVVTAIAAAQGCGDDSDNPSEDTDGGSPGTVSLDIPASGCGSVPTPQPEDPDGAVASLEASYQDDYAGYQSPVRESMWKDWKPSHDAPYDVAIAYGQLTTDFQVRTLDALRSELEENPDIGKVSVVTTGNQVNVAQQLQQFSSLLQDKPDLMIVEPLAEALDRSAATAAEMGIPTISVQNTTSSKYAVNIQTNNYGSAAQAASVILRMLNGRGNVLLVHGLEMTTVDKQTFAAVSAALENCPDVKVAGEISGNFVPTVAASETQKFLATHPGEIDAVFQTGGMAPGIINAFERAGRSVPIVADVGAMKGSLGYWIDNKADYTGFGQGLPPEDFGRAVANVAAGMLDGDGLKVSDVTAQMPAITDENLGEWAQTDWTLNTPGIADGPGDSFLAPSFLNGLFENPGSG